jgi:hypothetical protein
MVENRLLEPRRYPRHDFSTKFKGRKLSPGGFVESQSSEFQGNVCNISKGGLNVSIDYGLNRNDMIRGEVILPSVAVGVPSLFQVRWVHPIKNRHRFSVGLKFMV